MTKMQDALDNLLLRKTSFSVSRPPCRPDGARDRHTVTLILTRDFEQTVHFAD